MQRVSVVGTSGSGKSWMASRLASRLGVPSLELDSLRHQAGWQPLPDENFAQQVGAFVSRDAWVVDGNYFAIITEPVVWPRADTVVWVDPSRAVTMYQVIQRTLKRFIFRQQLWNGNRERLRDVVFGDPSTSVIRWAWVSHRINRQRYEAAMRDPRWESIRFVRLRSRGEMRRFLRTF